MNKFNHLIVLLTLSSACQNVHKDIIGKYKGIVKDNGKIIYLNLKRNHRFEYDMGRIACSRMRSRLKGNWQYSDGELKLIIDLPFNDTMKFMRDTSRKFIFRTDSFEFVKTK